MKKAEIMVGGIYTAKVSNTVVAVKVIDIRRRAAFGSRGRETTVYDVVSLKTNRAMTFHSAARFRSAVHGKPCPQCSHFVTVAEVYPFGMHRVCYARSNAAKLTPKTEVV